MKRQPTRQNLEQNGKSRSHGKLKMPNGSIVADPNEIHSFGIRIAARHHTGVQREILSCFHTLGVDCLQAHVYAMGGEEQVEQVTAFVATYHVIARGQKKDFDDDKLDEMHHHIEEILNDEDAQIIFEPAAIDFSQYGLVEVQVFGAHHPEVLHEITDELAKMGLDVLRAFIDHRRPETARSRTRRKSSAYGMSPGGGSDPNNSPPITPELSPTDGPASPRKFGEPASPNDDRKNAVVGDIGEMSHRRGALFALEDMEREVFYVREAVEDTEHRGEFALARRNQVKEVLKSVLESHKIEGTVMVRIIHENELPHTHEVVRFNDQENVTIITCSGTHHQQLLHEICDQLFEDELDVLHADVDQDASGVETHTFYVQKIVRPPEIADGEKPPPSPSRGKLSLTTTQMSELQMKIMQLYAKHAISDYTVSVKPLSSAQMDKLKSMPGKSPPYTGMFSQSPPSPNGIDRAIDIGEAEPMTEVQLPAAITTESKV